MSIIYPSPPWSGILCWVLGQETLLSQCLSTQVYKWEPANRPLSYDGHFESEENKKLCFCTSSLALDERLDVQNLLFQLCAIKVYLMLGQPCDGLEILLVVLCYGNRDKRLRPDELLGLYTSPLLIPPMEFRFCYERKSHVFYITYLFLLKSKHIPLISESDFFSFPVLQKKHGCKNWTETLHYVFTTRLNLHSA